MKKMVIIHIVLMAVLTGCGGAMRSEAPAEPMMETAGDFGYANEFDEVMVEREDFQASKALNLDDSIATADTQRMVIKNADLSIVVDDPLIKLDQISAMAEEMGGFVVDSNVWQNTLSNGVKVPHVNITIRVPVERLVDAMDQIKSEVSEITSENVSGQDVTGDYTDLESRLRNLEAAEKQLQLIMDEAVETEDVLQVYNNLVNVREQIEVIKGQMKYYKDAARLSRISIDITADQEAQPLMIGGWQPAGVAKDAIETMINTLQKLGDIAIWVVLCVVPVGIIVGIPLYFIVRYVLRLRKRRRVKKAEEVTEIQEKEVYLDDPHQE
jgi:hypothetical protein